VAGNLTGWNVRYGEFWMAQWQLSWWVSVGVHVDLKRRRVAGGAFSGATYGPYLDVHLGALILSLGWRPYLTGELRNSSGIARGGISVPARDDLRAWRSRFAWRTFVEACLLVLLALNLLGTYMRVKHWGLP